MMTASAALLLATALVAVSFLVPAVPAVPASAGTMGLLSKTAVFPEVIRLVPLNHFNLPLVIVQDETDVDVDVDVDVSPVATPVAIPVEVIRLDSRNLSSLPLVLVALQEEVEEEETVVDVPLVDTPLSFPTKNATGPSTYYDLLHETFEFASNLWEDATPRLQESFDLASSLLQDASPRLQESFDLASTLASTLWQDAPHLIAYSNEQVINKNGSAMIQVSKVSLHIFSTRFTVVLENGVVKASVVSISPEITRILSRQCPPTSPSQLTCNVDAMDVLASITRILSKQCPITPPSERTCNVDAMDILTSITMILSKQCPVTPPSKTTCDDTERPSTNAVAWMVWIKILVLIASVILGIHQRQTIFSLVYGIRRVKRKISSAVIFMNRAVNPLTFPEERTSLEVGELCACKLLCEHICWTGEVPTGEITDEVKAVMIQRVEAGRSRAYRQGKWDEPTMSECVRICCTEVSSSFMAEVHHLRHSSPDDKLRRDIGEKCHCVLKKDYTRLTGNEISEYVDVSTLREAVFQAHKDHNARRFCCFAHGC
jgi:hypothetical protein